MILFSLISNIMCNHAKGVMLHRPTDKVLYNIKVVKPKYRFACKKEVKVTIDNIDIILHYFNINKKETILYFPGGSFIDPPTFLHAKFAKKIAKKLKKQIIMVQYPLFPESNPIQTSILIRKLIDRLNINNPILMGDSAGACLCLYILHGLNMANKNIVNKTILISPWFDGTMKNENIPLIQQYDFVLNKDNCYHLASDVFSKYLNGRMYLCPTNDDFQFKSNILLISGEHEIFTPDAILWSKKQNILNVKHLVYKSMCHCFVILPIKEANHAIKKIGKFLEK